MRISANRQPWTTGHSSGHVITTRHYRLYTTSKNRTLVTYMPGFMEAAYANYLALTGLTPRGEASPMPIYLMASREEWAALTTKVVGAQANIYLSISAGGYCYKGVCVFWDIGGLGTMAVASHEGLHQFFSHQLADQLPLWLEEGLCVTAEGYDITGENVHFTLDRNTSRFNHLRTAIVQDCWIDLRQLLPMDAGDVVGGDRENTLGYYGQLWALVQFIRSDPRYSAGLARLLADAQAGRLHEAIAVPASALKTLRRRGRIYNRTVAEPLFAYYISKDIDSFNREYYAFAKALVLLE
jgi:hypothetical protein